MIDVLGPEKRRRRTTQEKIAIVQQSFEPGMTVSLVARQHGVAASQLFLWCKQYQEGSLTAVAAGEQVVPASELAAAMKQIKGHCCKVSDEAAFCLIQRPYISKTLLTRRISPRGSP